MSGEQVAPPINESFALRAPEMLSAIPYIAYVGNHEINCTNPSVFAMPDASFSNAWVQATYSYRGTNNIVGLKRDGEDFGMDYLEYLDFFTRLTHDVEANTRRRAALDYPVRLNGKPLTMDYVSVGRLYFTDGIGSKTVAIELNDLAKALGIQQPTNPTNHSEPLEYLTTISLYPSIDYAKYILNEAERVQGEFQKMSEEERWSVAHLQTCIPYSESQLATSL